jgi:hypothetical protein
MGGSDRGAHLDTIGLGIFAYAVARDSGALHSLARDAVLVQHAHSPHHTQVRTPLPICGASPQS